MKLASPTFRDGERIPVRNTHDGGDFSPPLRWSAVPAGAKSFAVICDDPDAPAGTWIHWLLYNVPATTTELPEHLPTSETLPGGARQAVTDFRRTGYDGPCPPPGEAHRYRFRLYALDTELALKARATKTELFSAMKGHVVAEASTVGLYERRR